MTSHPSQSYTLKTSSTRPAPCVPSTAIVRTLCVATRCPVLAHVLDSSFCSVVGGASLLSLAAFVYARKFSSSLRLFNFSLLPYPRSFLVFCSRDMGPAVLPRVAPSIFRLRGESGTYSQAPLLSPAFSGGAVLYCTVLYASFDVMVVGTNSLVDSTGSAPPMPLAMPL